MLQLTNLVRAAIRGILKNRLRSLLTSLGIIIGVSAVIVMVGIGAGASQQIQQRIASLGTDLLMIRPGALQRGGVSRGIGSATPFTFVDVDELKKRALLVRAISPLVRSAGQVVGGSGNWNTSIEGVYPAYQYIRDWQLAQGEFFTERDVKSRKKVAVIGQTIADELFAGQDPIGERIRIRNTPFTVIGVLKTKGTSAMGHDADDIILAPATTVLYRLKGGIYVDMIYASALSSDRMYESEQELTLILRDMRKIKEGDTDNFTVRNQAEITEMASSTSEVLTLLLGSIAAVSLLVGGIGIMNIMLVSVTERTREIGIRLSVGARERDILLQFLTESIMLSSIGGGFGILLAFLLTVGVNRFSNLSAVIQPGIIILAFSFACLVGIFFGFYPARKAAGLNPIDALRYE
ncbi:ABC transporter permease [candidate division KSB1 bacterium]|nr:ABC transporter permease [candidate division KSB1 bacterium]